MIIVLIADGRSIHTQRWAEYFADRGHEVHLITYDPMNRMLHGVTEHVISSRWKNLYLSFIPRHIAIKRLVKTIRPDIIHAHFIAKYGFHLPDLQFRPTVVSAWGDDVLILPKKSRLISWYTKKVLDSVDLVYAVSRNIGDHIVSDFSIPETKVHYLPFGIDTDLFTPRRIPAPGKPIRLRSSPTGVSSPCTIRRPLSAGLPLRTGRTRHSGSRSRERGRKNTKSGSWSSGLGLDNQITFRKKTAYADVPRDYQEADIFITTSVSDGTPVSVLEAMASGLPCIATSVGGIPEWIEHKVTGLLIRTGISGTGRRGNPVPCPGPAIAGTPWDCSPEHDPEERAMEHADGTGRERLSGTH